jgi:predicted small secreted protein
VNEPTHQRTNERTKQRTKFSISQFQTQKAIDICKKIVRKAWHLLLVALCACLLAACGNFSPGFGEITKTHFSQVIADESTCST